MLIHGKLLSRLFVINFFLLFGLLVSSPIQQVYAGSATIINSPGTVLTKGPISLDLSLTDPVRVAKRQSTDGLETAVISAYHVDQNGDAQAEETFDVVVGMDEMSPGKLTAKVTIDPVPVGTYNFVLHIDGYLDRKLLSDSGATLFSLDQGDVAIPAQVMQLVVGDVAPLPRADNVIDILDFNYVQKCMSGVGCEDKEFADLNKDGVVDQKDLDIITTNMAKNGDIASGNSSTTSKTVTCEPDPACVEHGGTVQMCSLVCTR